MVGIDILVSVMKVLNPKLLIVISTDKNLAIKFLNWYLEWWTLGLCYHTDQGQAAAESVWTLASCSLSHIIFKAQHTEQQLDSADRCGEQWVSEMAVISVINSYHSTQLPCGSQGFAAARQWCPCPECPHAELLHSRAVCQPQNLTAAPQRWMQPTALWALVEVVQFPHWAFWTLPGLYGRHHFKLEALIGPWLPDCSWCHNMTSLLPRAQVLLVLWIPFRYPLDTLWIPFGCPSYTAISEVQRRPRI